MKVDAEICVGCGGCMSGYDGSKKCPVVAISMKGSIAVIDEEHCVNCGQCKDLCALGAISD